MGRALSRAVRRRSVVLALKQRVADEHRALLDEIGLDLPEDVVADGDWKGKTAGAKTAVKPFPFSQLVERFPPHFEDTACVFHLPDGRCGLQVLAVKLDVHPWHFKPTGCWLHPIQILPGSPPIVRLPSRETDPYRFDEYDGYVSQTRCGEDVEAGQPAYRLLDAELEAISRLGDNDLLDEIRVSVRRRPS